MTVPSKVSNLRVISIGAHYIILAWDPQRDVNMNVEAYDVSYSTEGSSENASAVYTRQPNVTFQNLLQQTKYAFKVVRPLAADERIVTIYHSEINIGIHLFEGRIMILTFLTIFHPKILFDLFILIGKQFA